jgi:hypothetical protein
MMRFTRILLGSVAALALAGTAQAELVAGWDFSQYSGDGSLDTDNDFVGEGTLDANWSSVGAAPGGGGPAANVYGTMYVDGSNGSTLTDFAFGFPAEFAASAGDLTSNVDQPIDEGALFPYGACSATAPQDNCLPLKMKAIDTVSVVFEASLAPSATVGNNWALSFAGTTDAGSDSVTIETSTDGVLYTSAGSETLTTTDTEFVVPLGAGLDGEATIFVRLNLTGSLIDGSNIDNLGITADLPGPSDVPAFPWPMAPYLVAFGLAALGLRRLPGRQAAV